MTYAVWFKKNWFTLLGIFIIIMAVLVDYATVQSQKMTAVKDCNAYWYKQLEDRGIIEKPMAYSYENSSVFVGIGVPK